MVIAALVIGILALLLGLLAVLRMIWGGPKIYVSFEVDDREDGRFLTCNIFNEPIVRGFLFYMRVRREAAQDVAAAFEIFNKSTSAKIVSKTIASITMQIGLSAEPATLVIAFARYDFGRVAATNVSCTGLPIGDYRAEIEILFDNEIYKTKRDFTVTDKHPYIYWETKS